MKFNLSLKYRIAVIIFILEAIMMTFVLWQTLGQSYQASSQQIHNNELAILDLVSGISKAALITEEYAELQPYMEHLAAQTQITQLILSDARKTIVASTSSSDIGSHLTEYKKRPDHSWQIQEIKNASGVMGILAIEFSSKELNTAYAHARDFGISIAAIGMLIIAAVGVLVGFYLTRRLDTITATAHRLANGDLTARTNIHESDELGQLAAAFDDMVRRLLLSKEALRQTLSDVQESEQNLTITINSIGDAVITTDAEGNVTRMNAVAETLTGWLLEEAQQLPLKTIFPIIDASTREPIPNPIDKVLSTGETVYLSNHTTLISKDTTEYQIADSAAPIRDADGNILGMVLVFNDVTEQYQLRETAAKSRSDLQAIMDNSPAIIYVKDKDGRFTFINKQFVTMFQLTREEIIGKTTHDLFSKVMADEHQRNDKAVLAAGHALEFEEEARHPNDDELHNYNSTKFPLFNDLGEAYAVCGISTDITVHKKLSDEIRSSAQHLRLYREQAPMATIEWNTDFQVLDWNAAAEKMFGYTVDEVKGRDFVDVMLPKGAVVDVKQIWKDLMAQTGGEISINENLTKDGRIIICEWRNTALKDETGKVIGAASIVQDITERRQQEEQLRRSQKMDALGKLTGGIAHDYNNMLGVILGYTELLERSLSESPELKKYTHEIHRAGTRGAKLTQKLLAFSRQNISDAKVLDINATLIEAQLMLEKTLTARIQLDYKLADDLWPVWLDSSDLEDAILNMSINAMHAIKGNGQLTFVTSNEQLNETEAQTLQLAVGDYISLSIIDTGCGMVQKTIDAIFEPFFTTKGEKGTGLGLSQVYGFVHHSDGGIKVDSEPGHGTHFTIYFPRHHTTGSSDDKPKAGKATDLKGKGTILVVDDEPALLELTCEILELYDYSIFSAANGEQALKILEQEPVDMLLSDVIMPEMDGYQLAAIVQEKYPAIKIQLASGFSDNRHTNMSDDKLHQHLLNKPYNSHTLLQRIRELLE